MLRSVFLKSLRDQRRALMWWGIGLVTLAVMMMLFYPNVRDSGAAMEEYMKSFPKELMALFGGEFTEFTSPEGFLNSELFFLIVPLLFLIFTITAGSSAIAGEEEKGTLDLLLSNPLARWQVALEKFFAMVIATLALALSFWSGIAVGRVAVEMDIGLERVAAATLSAAILGMAFGALAFALGCISGNRGLSIGVTSAVGVMSYLLNALAPMVEFLSSLRRLSPFYYYIGADPLRNGLSLGHAGVLIALSAALLAVALVAFERRDLAV